MKPLFEMKFLVIDENSTIREETIFLLNENGFRYIEEAQNGAVALQKLSTEEFDFVIVDESMPDMSGLELITAMRSEEKLKIIPVLLAMEEVIKEKVIEAAQVGASGYIQKPVTEQSLDAKISRILNKLMFNT